MYRSQLGSVMYGLDTAIHTTTNRTTPPHHWCDANGEKQESPPPALATQTAKTDWHGQKSSK